ncbi:hypothetical protein UY3_15688 [Chelonia mydas]|uniref:Maestro/Maestro-like HEAT-repeats domain-containing protein n=1 Tax=Chelonia mydas TaxID=8469 RepID=M7BG73_CHEMY|nr:hypothetical protein UY3_15688 [Chelonia mydas]
MLWAGPGVKIVSGQQENCGAGNQGTKTVHEPCMNPSDMDEAALRKDIGTLFPALHSMETEQGRGRGDLCQSLHSGPDSLIQQEAVHSPGANPAEHKPTGEYGTMAKAAKAGECLLASAEPAGTLCIETHDPSVLHSVGQKVREALAYFIRTMGVHGLLEKSASRSLIDFLVHQCTLILNSTEEADGRRTMELEVRQLCSSTLQSLGDSPRMASEILRGKDWAWLQNPDQQHALLAISYLGTCSRGSALPAQERSRAVRASARFLMFYRFKANTEVSSTDPAAPRLAKENSGLRQASMELFGHLSKFVSKTSSLFRAEVEKSMGTLLIHLQDGNPQVTQDFSIFSSSTEGKRLEAPAPELYY